jgi:hypothetical protein
MTPEVARREVKAARDAGWYQMTWHHKYIPPGGLADKPAPDARRHVLYKPMRRDILRAIAAGHATVNAIAATMPTKTREQVNVVFRKFRDAAPWALSISVIDRQTHATLTDAGRELLRGWE